MLRRALGLLLVLAGAILAITNAVYLPSAIDAHHGEWPIVAFHLVVILVGITFVIIGIRLRKHAHLRRPLRSTPELRAALLVDCDRAYQGASASARGVRTGILAAEQAIRAEPDAPDGRQFLENVLAALSRERTKLDDPYDDDGFALGGLATVRNAVERLRDELDRQQ